MEETLIESEYEGARVWTALSGICLLIFLAFCLRGTRRKIGSTIVPYFILQLTRNILWTVEVSWLKLNGSFWLHIPIPVSRYGYVWNFGDI